MRLPGIRRTALLAAAIGLLAAGLGVSAALAARGGLSIAPGILEHPAQAGDVGSLEIANTTDRPMTVRLAARPWRQAPSGAVAPDRGRVLAKLRPNRRSFALAAGASRTIGLSLAHRPARGSLYGAIEATGTPRRSAGKGVKVAYRLVTSLRLYPPPAARRYRALPTRLFEHGATRRGALYLAVENAGNTIDPIGGRFRVSGRRHTLSGEIAPKTILPGQTVNLRLIGLRGTLPPGPYRVTVGLSQVGKRVGGLRRGVRLR